MKKITFSFTLGIMAFLSFGQDYSFNASTDTYTDLSNPVSLNNGLLWDDPDFEVSLGFDFVYFEDTIDRLFLSNSFLGGILSDDPDWTSMQAVLVAYGADIIDRGYDTSSIDGEAGSLSPLSYKLEGSAGNRIFKMEWKNAGFYSDVFDDNVSTDYTNFQLWLYESSGKIEVRFGSTSVTQPDLAYDGYSGPQVAFIPDYQDPYGIWLSGNPASPMLVEVDSMVSLTGTIPEGTVYTFTPVTIGLDENKSTEVSLYPNPAKDYLMVSLNQNKIIASVQIFDYNGKKVKQTNDTNILNTSDLAPGLYLIEISLEDETIVSKFLKN